MIPRLRLILPPTSYLFAFAVIYTLLEVPYWYVQWRFGVVVPAAKRPSLALLDFAALAYGVSRVAAFHPFFRPNYREWLERTPWTARQPLPVGPVSWVWEDGFVLLGLAAVAQANGQIDPVLLVALCVVSYGAVLTLTLFVTGASVLGYVSAFVLGLAVWLSPHHWVFLGTAAGANLLALIGFRRSLNYFPWSLAWQDQFAKTGKFFENQTRIQCGWPYDRLGPLPPSRSRFSLADAALTSMLVGWWLFVVASLERDPESRGNGLLIVLLYGAMFCFLGRVLTYCTGYAPPLSLWGRIVTLRWIIPGYDQVFIAPSCVVLAPLLARFVFVWGLPSDVAYSVGFALMLFVTLTCPPSLKRWRLTGEHRIVSAGHTKAEYVQAG